MPSTSTLPAVGSSRKLMHLRSVLFPEPERPKTTTTSPLAMSRSIPFRTSFSPNPLRTPRRLTIGAASVPMRAALPHVAGLEPLFEPSLEVGEDARKEPVDKGRDHQRLQALEVLAADLRGAVKDLLGTDEAKERGVFDHGYELVARRRDDDPHGLWQHYAPHRLRPRHTQCLRRLDLLVPDRLDAGAEDLRHVRPVVDPQSQNARRDDPQEKEVLQRSRGVLGELRQAEVDKEDLDDQGRPADKRDVEAAYPVEHGVPREPTEGAEQRERDGEQDAEDADQDRERHPGEDEREPLQHERRVELESREKNREQDEDEDPHHGQLGAEREPRRAGLQGVPYVRQGRDGRLRRESRGSGALLLCQVGAVPLLRELGERPVLVHLLYVLADLVDERLRVCRGLFVYGGGERLVVERVAHDLYRGAGVHRLLEGRQGGHSRVEARAVAEREVLDGRGVGVVGLYLRVVHDELVISGDVERALEVGLVGAPAAHPDPLAVEVGLQVSNVRVALVHRRGGRRVVVGRGEVENLGPRGGYGHRAHAEVPAPVPVTRGEDVPGGGHPLHLDAHALGDLLGYVYVEALELALVVQEGLRRVGRVGRDPDHAPVLDLLQEGSPPPPPPPSTAVVPRGAAAAPPAGGDHQQGREREGQRCQPRYLPCSVHASLPRFSGALSDDPTLLNVNY